MTYDIHNLRRNPLDTPYIQVVHDRSSVGSLYLS
jgi:hypothetical protein